MRLPAVLPLVLTVLAALGGLLDHGAAVSGTAPTDHAVWPLEPRPVVVRGFDPPESPWGSGHRGVDLLGRVGQPVRAAKSGRITFAGQLAGRGVVVIDHGSVRTTYEPVAHRLGVGAVVTSGQRIGVLELPMSHCFPRACLHWGLVRGETYLDPLGLLGLGPVRLLPMWGPATEGSPLDAPTGAPTTSGVGLVRPWDARVGMPAAVVPR